MVAHFNQSRQHICRSYCRTSISTSSELPGLRRLVNTGSSPVTVRCPSTTAVWNSGTWRAAVHSAASALAASQGGPIHRTEAGQGQGRGKGID